MKIRTVVLTGVVGYGLYKGLEKAVLTLPINVAFVAVEEGENVEVAPKFIVNLGRKFAMKLPYAGFCEITGCRFEVHSTYQESFERTMSKHLANDHEG